MSHPSIVDRERVETYVVSSSTDTFPVEWPVFPKDGDETDVDVDVYVNGALKDRATWSFSGTFKDGIAAKGDVIFDAAISSGTVRIVGNIPGERSSDFSPGTVNPASLDTEFDKIWARLRELELQAKRAPKIPAYDDDADESPVDQVLPALAGRKNKTLAFDANGRPIAGTNDVTVGWPVFNVADYGAALDGTTDDTTAINNAISAANTAGGGDVIVTGDFHVSAPSDGAGAIVMKSNVRLIFLNDARGTLEPNAFDGYQMIRCEDISNFAIIGAHLTGDLDGHTGSTGEAGMCISVLGATDWRLENCTCRKAWADGIYVSSGTQAYSLRGRIVNADCDANRRQGMSIISCDDLEVVGGAFRNTSGTAPQAGIDVEPNQTTQRIKGLRLIYCRMIGNVGDGLLIHLNSFDDTTEDVDIVAHGLHVESCNTGVTIRKAGEDGSGNYVKGAVWIDRVLTNLTNENGIMVRDWDKDGPAVFISYPVILDPNDDNPQTAELEAGIAIVKMAGDSVATTIGNVTVACPFIHDRRGSPKMDQAFFIRDNVGSNKGEEIQILDPVRVSGNTGHACWNDEGAYVRDPLRTMVRDVNSDETVSGFNYRPLWQNKTFTVTRTRTLSSSLAVGTEVAFEMIGTQTMVIAPDTGETILNMGNGSGSGGAISLTEKGQRVKLRKISSTEWLPIEVSGFPHAVLGFFGATPVVQPAGANQAALTNSTGGSQDGTLAAVSGSGADAAINDNFTDIYTLLDEIRTALVNAGIMKGSA